MPKLHAISQGPWHLMRQQQQQQQQPRQTQQMKHVLPSVGEAPAQSLQLMVTAVERARMGNAHEGESSAESAENNPGIFAVPNARSLPRDSHSEESNVHSAGRVMGRRGRAALLQSLEALTTSEVAIDRGYARDGRHLQREGRPRVPSETTARALEELFNEKQSAEEQQVQRGMAAQRVARSSSSPLSTHQHTIMAEEEDLFSNTVTRSYTSIATAGQGGMWTAHASSRVAMHQHTVHKALPTPREADVAVRAEPRTSHEPLRVWLPRCVEALCAPACVGHPQNARGTAPPRPQSSAFLFESGDGRAYGTQHDDADDNDGSLQVALWRRTPRSTPPCASVEAGGADGSPTSLLSSPRWCVTAYESLSLSLPSTAWRTDDNGEGSSLQQAPDGSTAFPHRDSSMDSSGQRRSGAREEENVATDIEDDGEAAAVSDCRDHRLPTAIATPHGSATPASALTRVYWGPASPLRAASPGMRHRGGTTEHGASGNKHDHGGNGAAFEGSRGSRRIIRRSVQSDTRAPDQRAQHFSVSPSDVSSAVASALPGQNQRGGARGYDGGGSRASRDSTVSAGMACDGPLCELPSSLSSVTCQGRRAVTGTDACAPMRPKELQITLPWLLHTSALPPVAAAALVRCLKAHIQAHLPPAAAAQRKQNGTRRTQRSGACTYPLASAHSQAALSPQDDAPPPPSPPPSWVAVFAYTEAMHMYATNHASSLVHAEEDTRGCVASRGCPAGPCHVHGGLASAAQLDRIPWPAWVPDAQTSVCLLAALTSGAFMLIEMIARALDEATAAGSGAASVPADMCAVEGGGTAARYGSRAIRHPEGHLHIGIDALRTAAPCPRDAATVLQQLHVFCEAVFGDAANKRLCRHVRDRLPMHVRDLSELVYRPWCGISRGAEGSDPTAAATAVADPGVWRARCPSMLDLVHHLARTWMAECFAGLADRLHLFLITHNPGVVLDLICTRANVSDNAVPPDNLCKCLRPLKRVCDETWDASARAQQHSRAPVRERHHCLRHGCSVETSAVPGAAEAAAQVLPPHASIYRGIAEFIHGPLQRWERWWLSSSTPATNSLPTTAIAQAAAMQWSTHVNYATVHSLQWVLRHPRLVHAVEDGVRQSAFTQTAVTDMLALLELLTLMPPLLDTTALLMCEAEAVLRGACARVMGNASDGGNGIARGEGDAGSHSAVKAGTAAAPSCAATQGFHAYYRVFLGLVCCGAIQLSDAEAMALLSQPQPAGMAGSTVASHHRDAAPPLPEWRSAQATVDSLWTRHILPLAVGYVSGSGTGAAGAAPMDALTAADQCIVYALMLLQLLRLEARSARRGSRGCAQAPAFPTGAQQDVPSSGVSSSRHRRKRARSAALGGSAPPSTHADEHPSTARSPAAGSVSSSALTADTGTTTTTATTNRCVNCGVASISELERVGAAVAEVRYSAAAARGAAAGLLDDFMGALDEEQLAPRLHRIPPLELLAHEVAGEGAAAAPQRTPCSALPPDWQGVCRHLIRRWLQPQPRAALQSAGHARGCSSRETKTKMDCHDRGCRASMLEETTAHQEETDSCASIQVRRFSEGLPQQLQWLAFYEEGNGYTLHRRDIRRVGAFLAGLARRVAAVREEERGAHAESTRSDCAGRCYDYLYGVLPPGLRARDAGLITIANASTTSSDDGEAGDTYEAGGDAETDDDLCDVNILRCSASTTTSSSSSSSESCSRSTLGTTSKTPVSPSSSSPAASV
ncbi:hypothetical protein GH5_08220 [Leishmania sp. Ghana 2012 LV757]|uniref:hypothetical protein n=1 Tax=Leishmania sp. Ghana 2012 LV757 TaxID=2803181 RepID=UPI001B458497|nr:hypothetical protein GH5_08220 [Leishmania sp. Ghana 2012 LV757]